MSYFGLAYDFESLQGIAMVASATIAIILFIINVPHTEYTTKLNKTKNSIAISYIITAGIFFYTLSKSDIVNYELFSSVTMLIIVAITSNIQSYSLINLLNQKHIESNKFYFSILIIGILSVLLTQSIFSNNAHLYLAILITSVVLFILQSIYHIILFDKSYKLSKMDLERYYDEDENIKLRWIRFCYIIMMLTDLIILIYLILPKQTLRLYLIFYLLFLIYFAGNFISFIGSHKLLLDAFGHDTLTGKTFIKFKNKSTTPSLSYKENEVLEEKEFKKLQKALDKWVEKKKYREFDQSREEIAHELGTTKEILYSFFILKIGKDFRTWRTNLRIEDAKSLLLDSKRTSTNIVGEMVGFSDRSNFHRQFKKIVGVSPKEWRDSNGRI